ncbi:MAG: hypothetical protein QW474_02225 [Candidatus Aenigmatarchaeota archaeon]
MKKKISIDDIVEKTDEKEEFSLSEITNFIKQIVELQKIQKQIQPVQQEIETKVEKIEKKEINEEKLKKAISDFISELKSNQTIQEMKIKDVIPILELQQDQLILKIKKYIEEVRE